MEAVFSQAQVDPLPPPAQPVPLIGPSTQLDGDSLAWARDPLHKLASELGYTITTRPLADGHGGSCDPTARVLTINAAQSVNAQISVTCHELAHALVRADRQPTDPALDYAQEELVAESVAHIAVSYIGLDSSPAAVPYLASWAHSAPADTFQRVAELVDRLARRLEDALGATDNQPETSDVADSDSAAAPT